jgi:hypothetical protein
MKLKLPGEGYLEKLLSSEVKVELLVLFHGNPGVIDTVDGIAMRIGRNGRDIEPDLEEFVELGILEKRTLGKKMNVFYLDRSGDNEMQNSLDLHFKGLRGRRGADLTELQ